MSLVLDVTPDQADDVVFLRLPDGGGVVRLRIMVYQRPDRHDPTRTHRSVRAVIDAPTEVEVVRAGVLARSQTDFAAWAAGTVDMRGHTRARHAAPTDAALTDDVAAAVGGDAGATEPA